MRPSCPHIRLACAAVGLALGLGATSVTVWAAEPSTADDGPPTARAGQGDQPPAAGASAYVVYQPSRASNQSGATGAAMADRYDLAQYLEESRALQDNPHVSELMERRLQGEVITASTPSLTDEQRAALDAVSAFSERWRGRKPPPPPPPPPPPAP